MRSFVKPETRRRDPRVAPAGSSSATALPSVRHKVSTKLSDFAVAVYEQISASRLSCRLGSRPIARYALQACSKGQGRSGSGRMSGRAAGRIDGARSSRGDPHRPRAPQGERKGAASFTLHARAKSLAKSSRL